MKRLFYILLLSVMALPLFAGIHSYADHSVLSSGHWVKIRVSQTGVCRMTFSELDAAGLNAQQLRVFGYGGALKTQDFSKSNIDDLPQVPVYVGNDYVLFYVQGPISWTYNGTRFVHTRNHYSDYGYYLLTDDAGSLLSLPMADAIEAKESNITEITKYAQYQVHEKDSLNLIDRSGVSGGGREFFGEQFNPAQRRTFTFSTPNADTGDKSTVYASVAARSGEAAYFYFYANGSTSAGTQSYLKGIEVSDNYTMARPGTASFKPTSAANSQSLQLHFSAATGALGWLNYIELTTPSQLTMTGSWLPIRTQSGYQQQDDTLRFNLKGANSSTQIWEVTDLSHIVRVPATLSNDTLRWLTNQKEGVREYVAVNPTGNNFVSATIVGNVANQDLHKLSNIDYVIICPDGYQSIARDLAEKHKEKQSITYAIVTDQQVYNEFSSGTPDATAYRWLMKMLYDRADGNANVKPRWLLLMGHGSFDNRKLLPNSGTSLLLTYQAKNSTNEVDAYCTDDYFGFMEDNEGDELYDSKYTMDISVGRLPVSTTKEAREVVDKLITYMENENAGKWKNQIIFLADDGDHGGHTETAEGGAERVRIKNPDFVVNKIYLDAYPQEVNASGESYPLAKNRLDNLLKSGVLFFDYSGHGGYNAITNESMLNLHDIEAMNNRNLAFWLFATCSFAHCDGGKRSSAEAAVLNPNGAAVGVLSATRTVYATQNTIINRSVCDTLFGHSNVFHYDMTIGEATAIGKNMTGTDANKMAYILLGDPAIRLNYPTDYQVKTVTSMDTLNALDVQHVNGQIVDEDNTVVSDFNGKVDITVYDKMQVITTRDNDAQEGQEKVLSYNDYPNIIFSGAADVKDGLFNYTFMVPKDIRYNYGNGRIVYYARTTDSLELAEAVGHFEDFVVGGTGSLFTTDTLGPEMTIYLNTPAFQDGGKTYETPRFFAELYDEHGINTAGAGIGHDLMLIVDNNPRTTYSLNEYFTAANDSYKEGLVSYLMEKLPNGAHTLTFRAWDLLNNSTTKTLNFIVEAGTDPSIYSVTTYPNPVPQGGTLNLIVQYDQPDELLTTELYLYNLSGQMVWSHVQNNPDQVQIPLANIGLQPGVYVYAVKLKSATSHYSTAAGKIIVTK